MDKQVKSLVRHGMTGTSAHNAWRRMLQRCRANPTNKNYKWYGLRGIKVCKRWLSFVNFYADMGDPPDGKTLDRFPDNNGSYSPSNCRWATVKEQARNTRSNRIIRFLGRSQPMATWAEEFGITDKTLHYRLKSGWTVERAITTPTGWKARRENCKNGHIMTKTNTYIDSAGHEVCRECKNAWARRSRHVPYSNLKR